MELEQLENWGCFCHFLGTLRVTLLDLLVKPQNLLYRHSVMQSEENRFCGDVALNSFNKASRNEDNILDKRY